MKGCTEIEDLEIFMQVMKSEWKNYLKDTTTKWYSKAYEQNSK